MKRSVLFFACFLLAAAGFAQGGNSGLGFNYQAVVRGLDGYVIPSKSIELRFSLMPGQQATQASWVETQNVTTDAYGTIGVTVGKGTRVNEAGVAANFTDVNFAAIHYWLRVEINESGNYRELSYTALASVPYAEAATNAISSPVGSVMPFAGDASKVPAGWLLCDGSAVSRSDYAALYDVIGTSWGFGNNSTTFNLPDMRGVFLRGVSGNSGKDEDADTRVPLKDGGIGGNNVGSYQQDELKSHTHTYATKVHSMPQSGSATQCWSGDATAETSATGGNETRPKNVYVNYIIKY